MQPRVLNPRCQTQRGCQVPPSSGLRSASLSVGAYSFHMPNRCNTARSWVIHICVDITTFPLAPTRNYNSKTYDRALSLAPGSSARLVIAFHRRTTGLNRHRSNIAFCLFRYFQTKPSHIISPHSQPPMRPSIPEPSIPFSSHFPRPLTFPFHQSNSVLTFTNNLKLSSSTIR
jgi:hypothetical protein